jgi:hypothetical protein
VSATDSRHLPTAGDECLLSCAYQMLPTVPIRDWAMEGGSESAVAVHGRNCQRESHCRPAGRWRYPVACRRCRNASEIGAGGYRALRSRARRCQRRIVVVIRTRQRTSVLSYAYQTLSTVAVHGCNCQRESHVALPMGGVQSHPPTPVVPVPSVSKRIGSWGRRLRSAGIASLRSGVSAG